MNKELIKELEACGFVIGSLDILSKKLDNKYLCEYRVPTEELWISQDRSVLFTKMHQTFAQIAEKVLELTGVTLTPKQTKRQEIDTLREELETVKSRLNNLSSWAMSENKRRDVDLRALKYNLKKNGILVDPLTEPKSEPEKTEGVFKVGDPVVLVCEDKERFDPELSDVIKNRKILTVIEPFLTIRADQVAIEGNGGVYHFLKTDLQHAPKEAAKVLKYGGWAELMQNLGGWAKGTKVLLISKVDQSPESVFKFFLCANGDGEHQKINSDYLKAL
jgi:hypothetical protein